MLFNSISFAFFLPVVFALYWFAAKNLKLQNFILLISSFYFYGSWDSRFLVLLIFSISLDYFSGLKIYSAETNIGRRIWLLLSIIINVGFLGLFKYYNFFASSFAELLSTLGFKAHYWSLKVILPVGISFYTFHGLSYIFDIYNRKITPERNYVNYAVFVSFFPLLVAGPIERATHLLPQIIRKREFDYTKASCGLRQILWGLFKKIVIADNCASFANSIFANSSYASGSTLVLGALFFTFQIYCDFSGYSDIAIGTAKLFGIDLLRNFAFPYFSRDIAEFWRRWHISLSSWFKDYLYIPLGGSKAGSWKKVRNIFIIFLVSGFWHGANWTFIAWGLLNALFILPSILMDKNRTHLNIVAQGRNWPTFKEAFSIVFTFMLTVFAWIFFRADSLHHAFQYISGIFSNSLFSIPDIEPKALISLFIAGLFFLVEWHGREQQFALERLNLQFGKPVRWAFYFVLILTIFYWGGKEQAFIYFQF
jgi:D-alanyl-lipoteichoic acid acyltransferase DltB (MBOAT superfamily)